MAKHSVKSRLVKQLRHAAKGVTLLASLMRQGDAAALHDIRVQVRTVSSVLQPFVDLPHAKPVRRRLTVLKAWVRKSNRVRDTEAQLALIAELLPEPFPLDVSDYLAQTHKELLRRRRALAGAKALDKLPRRMARLATTVDACLARFSPPALNGILNQTCDTLLSELREDTARGLDDAKLWHQSRLRIKQLRYLIECFGDVLDARFLEFAADTKLAQDNLGRLRDWQNLRVAMAAVPVMHDWLAAQSALEEQLQHQAHAAMAFLARKLENIKLAQHA